MSNQWFRSWHGAPTDPKWRLIAKKAEVPTSLVVAFMWALMDRASQSEDRGSFAGVDLEVIADYLDCDCNALQRIATQCNARNVACNGRFVAWEKHQPKREDDTSTERNRLWREKQKNPQKPGEIKDATQCNAMQRTATLDKIREDKDNISTLVNADAIDAPVSDFKKIKQVRDDKKSELIQNIVGEWNDFALAMRLPQVVHITPARQANVLRRATELVDYYDYPDPIAGFRGLFEKIRGSPFLRGEKGEFRADFDFVITQSSFTKIMENRYEGQQKKGGSAARVG